MILHWDGSFWARIDVTARAGLRTVWSYGPDEVYTGGADGFLFRYDGSAWSQIFFRPPTAQGTIPDTYVDMWGPVPGTVAAMTDASYMVFYDGTDRPPWYPIIERKGNGGAVWARDAMSFLIVDFDFATRLEEGVFDDLMRTGATDLLFDLWGPGVTELLAVKQIGTMLHYDGTDWTRTGGGVNTRLRDVSVSPTREAIAVGWDGTVLSRPPGGTQWQETLTDIHYDFSAVWCGDATTVAVGRYTNTPHTGPDDIYAVGAGRGFPQGVVYHFDGVEWTVTEIDRVEECYDTWLAPAGDVWVAADMRRVVHFNGSEWEIVNTGAAVDLFAITRTPSGDLWVAGWEGELIRYDGNTWQRYIPNTKRTLRGAVTLDTGELLFVGDGGAVLRLPMR